jgi:hypothetical protein
MRVVYARIGRAKVVLLGEVLKLRWRGPSPPLRVTWGKRGRPLPVMRNGPRVRRSGRLYLIVVRSNEALPHLHEVSRRQSRSLASLRPACISRSASLNHLCLLE